MTFYQRPSQGVDPGEPPGICSKTFANSTYPGSIYCSTKSYHWPSTGEHNLKGLPNCNVISCITFNNRLTIICTAKIASPPVFCTQRGSALYLLSHRMTISTNTPVHLLRSVFTLQGYIPNQRGPDLSFLRWLQIPRLFPSVSCPGSTKAVQWPRPGPKIGDKSQQIPR